MLMQTGLKLRVYVDNEAIKASLFFSHEMSKWQKKCFHFSRLNALMRKTTKKKDTTEPLTIFEPYHPSNEVSQLHKVRQYPDCEAQNCEISGQGGEEEKEVHPRRLLFPSCLLSCDSCCSKSYSSSYSSMHHKKIISAEITGNRKCHLYLRYSNIYSSVLLKPKEKKYESCC